MPDKTFMHGTYSVADQTTVVLVYWDLTQFSLVGIYPADDFYIFISGQSKNNYWYFQINCLFLRCYRRGYYHEKNTHHQSEWFLLLFNMLESPQNWLGSCTEHETYIVNSCLVLPCS